ncbi:putative chaperonin [Escherichia coli]|uniref:Putative chaperonin n=1 Tax=Escherichia coli TaxID=562 RepID=A0A376P884_ECOLX|nr:putative chaperonin [Escherichia coli]
MKTNIKVFTSTGELTTLGRELGKGGEGAVYDIEEFVDSVAKIYHTPPPASKQDKLAFMAATADAQLLNYVAGRRQRFTVDEAESYRFYDAKVSGKEPIHMIYSPAHRRHVTLIVRGIFYSICAQYCFIFCYGSRARARRG